MKKKAQWQRYPESWLRVPLCFSFRVPASCSSEKLFKSFKVTCPLADLSKYQPTQFQPVGLCKKSTGNQPRSYPHIGPPTGDGWFSWSQPLFQPCALRYEGWNGVGFCKTNRHSNYMLWYTKVGTRLVFAEPTVGFHIWGLEIGWFWVDFLHKATKHGWISPRGSLLRLHLKEILTVSGFA